MRRHLIIVLLAMVGLFLGTNGFAQKKGPGTGDIASKRQKVSKLMPLWWKNHRFQGD